MSKIERGLSAIPDVTLARVNLTDRRVALEWKAGRARPGPFHRSAGRARLQGLSVRAGPRRSDGDRAGELPAALPRRRRLCRDERHDAVDPGVVRQCQRHDPGAARFLPLAVGADCAAGRGLCGPAVLPIGLARAAGAQHQHGRADLDRHRAGARDVGGRDHPSRRTCLFRRGADAARLPAGRPLSRPEHAPQDARGGRKSRRAEGGNRDQVRRRRRNQRRADCRGAGRRHRAAASGRALRGRRLRDRGAVQDRPEPDHRRNPAA